MAANLAQDFLRFGYRILIRLLPRNRIGDFVFAWVNFVIRHRRLPSKRMLFNDVLFHIKTSDEILDPLRQFVTDKEFMKIYVRETVGDAHNVPTVAVLKSAEEIDAFTFPDDCCIKSTHGSGKVILRRETAPIDGAEIKRWLELNHYDAGREANYRYVKPKIIVEPIIFDSTNLFDYKIFCFNSKPKLIQVDLDRYTNHTRKYFDTKWIEQDFSLWYSRNTTPLARPGNLDDMLRIAGQLSANFGFIRIDLYTNGEQCLVGEITNCADCANAVFLPREAEETASQILFC